MKIKLKKKYYDNFFFRIGFVGLVGGLQGFCFSALLGLSVLAVLLMAALLGVFWNKIFEGIFEAREEGEEEENKRIKEAKLFIKGFAKGMVEKRKKN